MILYEKMKYKPSGAEHSGNFLTVLWFGVHQLKSASLLYIDISRDQRPIDAKIDYL